MEKNHLHILWTNADPVTAEQMVLMYTDDAIYQKVLGQNHDYYLGSNFKTSCRKQENTESD